MDVLRHKVLVWAGIYKFHSDNFYLGVCHDVYRVLVIVMISLFSFQHIIYIYLCAVRGDDIQWNVVVLLITLMSFIVKLVTVYVHSKDIDEIHDLIKASMFGPTCTEDENILKKSEKQINILLKIAYINLAVLNVSWIFFTIGHRLKNESAVIPSYFPFDTNPWSGYLLAFLLEWVILSIWCGFALFSIDCSLACYNIRAASQLNIINYHLERMFDDVRVQSQKHFQYKDLLDRSLNHKFIYYVQRYQNIHRFIDNVNTAFSGGTAFQFFSVTACLSYCVYKMSLLVLYYQVQNFLYCYFGNLVKSESDLVCTSMYFSDWTSASPRFRRQMLTRRDRARWARPITPRVSIVPVTLATFEEILRLSYTFYTIMKSRNMTMN
ncbi:hypothetical protein ABMA28_015758 [Loxostege sticticalis]|uniref:Odorant receptor n=1 Tax=Loxostege sticticalis TaxID=481309 RepID=A0ABD0TDB7_LOXSC